MGHEKGVFSHWRYSPKLEWIGGVQTNQYEIRNLVLSPDGDWFAMTASTLWEVELRRFDDLSVFKRLKRNGN